MTAPTSTAVIRQWARDNGLPVGERGRLSPELLSAYASSSPSTPAAPATTTTTATPARTATRRSSGAVHVPIQPTPGATGIAHKITARNS